MLPIRHDAPPDGRWQIAALQLPPRTCSPPPALPVWTGRSLRRYDAVVNVPLCQADVRFGNPYMPVMPLAVSSPESAVQNPSRLVCRSLLQLVLASVRHHCSRSSLFYFVVRQWRPSIFHLCAAVLAPPNKQHSCPAQYLELPPFAASFSFSPSRSLVVRPVPADPGLGPAGLDAGQSQHSTGPAVEDVSHVTARGHVQPTLRPTLPTSHPVENTQRKGPEEPVAVNLQRCSPPPAGLGSTHEAH